MSGQVPKSGAQFQFTNTVCTLTGHEGLGSNVSDLYQPMHKAGHGRCHMLGRGAELLQCCVDLHAVNQAA